MGVVPVVFSNAYQQHPCMSCDDPMTIWFLGGLGVIVGAMIWTLWRM